MTDEPDDGSGDPLGGAGEGEETTGPMEGAGCPAAGWTVPVPVLPQDENATLSAPSIATRRICMTHTPFELPHPHRDPYDAL